MITEIHDMCFRWADWVTGRVDNGLGYPHKTIEHELIKMGGVLIRADGGTKLPVTDEFAEQLDGIIRTLPEPLHTVVVVRYLYRGGPDDKATVVKDACNLEQCSKREYWRMLDTAHVWLQGALSHANRKQTA